MAVPLPRERPTVVLLRRLSPITGTTVSHGRRGLRTPGPGRPNRIPKSTTQPSIRCPPWWGCVSRVSGWAEGELFVKNVIRPLLAVLAILVGVTASAQAEEIVLRPGKSATTAGAMTKVSDSTASAGVRVSMPDAGRSKVATALAAPRDYFELTFTANAGTAYRLWFRGKAASNSYNNDSVHVQFSGSVTSSGSAAFRIGTTASTVLTLEDCSGCGVYGWGWNDNYYGSSTGSLIYFASTGTQKIRVQNREDGLSIDQIVLSPVMYRSAAPGKNKNDGTILDVSTGGVYAIIGGSTTTSPTPTSPSTSYSGVPLKVMHYNLHHGVGTDGRYDLNRIANVIAKVNPDVISLNEVEKYTSWGNEDQPARYKALIESKTGRKYYMVWAQEYGQWTSNGKGNLLLSRYPFSNTSRYEVSYERTLALGQITVNGRNITVATTHLDPESSSRRYTQTQQMESWFQNFSQNRIIVGDMNAQPTSTEMTYLKNQGYRDAWADAKAGGYAFSPSDNPNGYTRNSRIDILYTSTGVSNLKPRRVEVIETRDSSGVMPSDHRPLVVTYDVQ
jgi:endonuclease/exonuclease/phosphatase family metal-dependent hydrolase